MPSAVSASPVLSGVNGSASIERRIHSNLAHRLSVSWLWDQQSRGPVLSAGACCRGAVPACSFRGLFSGSLGHKSWASLELLAGIFIPRRERKIGFGALGMGPLQCGHFFSCCAVFCPCWLLHVLILFFKRERERNVIRGFGNGSAELSSINVAERQAHWCGCSLLWRVCPEQRVLNL